VILKSLTRRNNTLQLVNYLFKEKEVEKIQPILKHNLRSRTTKGWAKEFDANEALRVHKRKDNIKVTHTILSFSNKDKERINNALLKDISKKFVELRGKDNLYLASSHHDKDHIHLHIVMSATKYLTGESNRISKKEFHELKLSLDSYQKQKYEQLIYSLPAHGKSLKDRNTENEHLPKNHEGKVSQKQELLETAEALYSKSKSLNDFLSQLKSEGYEPYFRGGQLYGLENSEGRHFRFKTIGFDKNKLDELDRQQEKDEKELKEIRDFKSMEKELDNGRIIEHSSDGENEDDTDDSEYDGLGL
jgi:hypothetical protein